MVYDESINDEINLLGDSVTLRVVSKDNYNKWGDVNESSSHSDTKITAISNTLSSEDLEVREGKFRNGDKRFFFKSDATNVTLGNRIYHDGLWYEIKDVSKHYMQDETQAYEVLAKKI